MIPKKLHYIWIGENEKPPIFYKCLDSWKKYLSDFEIVEWNENNYDITKNEYLKKAYESKKWAFVSDYMRFDILCHHGGVYVDTDVEFIKSLPDSILENDAFTGLESATYINPGMIFGCHKNNWFAKEIITLYENFHFDSNNLVTINKMSQQILSKYGYEEKDEHQIINELNIYPTEYFCGFNLDIKEIEKTENTISVHHYAGSWTEKKLHLKFKMVLKSVVGIELYKKILIIKRKLFGIKK